ncbi:DExH-box ATP-dependent RNA helicase [Salix suchowensis]|nr:DExH-box ATP-dependent RNA helicase [Salix suchowensis]
MNWKRLYALTGWKTGTFSKRGKLSRTQNLSMIEIKELDDFAQAAFHGYKSLNRIQSWIFQTVYYTNENILVIAPTGAGKTNIAMISILHEIGQHFKDGYLHKDEFKIVYVAPMKALAAEVTSAF